jgi:hypothetical protein
MCILTPNMPLIHTSFTYSKLNMYDFSILAGPLGYVEIVDSIREVLRMEFPPCAKEVIFIT